ncbi:hypothetical protein KUCAC02_033094 [Chaenocephalus aceratus]|nr:hypothetical protein KUCAC02_033094 [Chaenocephalus aceratus]
MFWMLFRALCCLCSNRQSMMARVRKLSNLKRNAIDVTTDVIVAENLLRRHGDDSGLLMYKESSLNPYRRWPIARTARSCNRGKGSDYERAPEIPSIMNVVKHGTERLRAETPGGDHAVG